MDIEARAIWFLDGSLNVTSRLEANTLKGEKGPSWDGHILVYANSNKSKEGIARVPIQVKGVKSENLIEDTIKYDVDIVDLQNFFEEGGAIYFVVYMDTLGNGTIYYKTLLPYNIKSILDAHPENTKTIRLSFSKFPSDETAKTDLFLNFVKDKSKQGSVKYTGALTFESIDPANVKYYSLGFSSIDARKNPYEYLFNHEVFVYAFDNDGAPKPLGLVQAQEFSKFQNDSVYCNGKKYFDKVKICHKKDYNEIVFGENIFMRMPKNDVSYQLHFDLGGTLQTRKRDISFLLDWQKTKKVIIGEKEFLAPLENNSGIIETSELVKYYKKLEELSNCLNEIGVKSDVNLNEFTFEDNQNAEALVDAFVRKQPLHLQNNNEEIMIRNFKIANITALIIGLRQDDGTYILKNFFKHKLNKVEGTVGNESFALSQFLPMNKTHFLNISNIDYDEIYNDIININGCKYYYDWVIRFVLEMLLAYDINKDKKLLNEALRLYDWLQSVYNIDSIKPIHLINSLQIAKRLRKLKKEEINRLNDFVEQNNIKDIYLLGAHILLGNKNSAKRYYGKLSENEKKEFNEYPIANLWKSRK